MSEQPQEMKPQEPPKPQPPQRYEKEEEKEEEKEQEKQREKQDEKSWDEKWRRDPLGAAIWAAILIWAGLVLLADNIGLLGQYAAAWGLARLEVWNFIFLGAGVIVLLEALIRSTVPAYRRPIVGTIIWGIVLIGIGVGDVIGWGTIWPFILIAIGLAIILRGLVPRK